MSPIGRRIEPPVDSDHFGRQLSAEWIKLRSVRGWVAGFLLCGLLIATPGLLFAALAQGCSGPGGITSCPTQTIGPDGEAVNDKFFYVYQPLTGGGSVTARVTSLTGLITYPPTHPQAIVSGVVPWAKAGLIITASTRPGSAYAAVMVTGDHGVRMQYDFTSDHAGLAGRPSSASPRWLRLTRSGDSVTGYDSRDGLHWANLGTVHLSGLPPTVDVGLFVASPSYVFSTGSGSAASHLTQATATFDHVRLQGGSGEAWRHDDLGAQSYAPRLAQGAFSESDGTFVVSGSGDIGPETGAGNIPAGKTLIGTPLGMIPAIVVAVLFITAEYRDGLIRTTLAANPKRARVLAAKALVLAGVAFTVALAATLIVQLLGEAVLRAKGVPVSPVPFGGEVQMFLGTAALVAVTAAFALAVGAILRRAVAGVVIAIGLVVLPDLLGIAGLLPTSLSEWLLRLTPAAGFAIQQLFPAYPQVDAVYAPFTGYYPLPPVVGFGISCLAAVLVLGLAALVLRRRDA
jgi:ABC-type transport system involved in multi-copper enzyme maturation permease subunit